MSAEQRLTILAGGLVCLFGGYFYGRYTTPAKVEYKTQVVYEDRIVEKRVEVKGATRIIYRDRVTKPDGTKIEHETEREETETETNTETETETAVTKNETKTETNRPDFKIVGLVGVQLNGLSPVYGGLVERRLFGPVSVGAWGLSSGVGGVSLSLEF